jgi:hypothetical protein
LPPVATSGAFQSGDTGYNSWCTCMFHLEIGGTWVLVAP